MTTLYMLGSGSSGNAFAIGCEEQALLVDAGFSAREIAQRAERVGFDLSRLVGIAITHEHGDH
ncbi:MAG TPA: MBL fold metallo-hydrolase, partial [Gemmatimonadales bacterium]|nr:MBL fold metallo-hydrolase [Gemmatimonadales bacterium]